MVVMHSRKGSLSAPAFLDEHLQEGPAPGTYAGIVDDKSLPGRSWRHGERTFSSTYHAYQHRVERCLAESPALQQCRAEAGTLYNAMAAAPILDTKRNYIGEQHRIVTRAQALREALEDQDPFIQHIPWEAPLVETPGGRKPAAAPPPAAVHGSARPKPSAMERGEVTTYSALQSACLLLAALYEKTPFSDTDIRKRVFADFSILKRDFRHCQMRTLHGPTTSISELFGSVKDLDRAGLADNVTGIVFDDWTVHQRADAFLSADLAVEAICLTQEGPVGKLSCRLRTFVILALLQERLLAELFESKFVTDPVRGFEPMTMEDPIDLLDFVEAMVRNTPNAYAAGKGLYYAWLYAPEVNATPEEWEAIFGKGSNRLPSLYDCINTPDVVVADPESDSGYSLDLAAAAKTDFSEAGAQAAVGFPWADDLIGSFLRKLRDQRQAACGVKRQRSGCLDEDAGLKREEANRDDMVVSVNGNGSCHEPACSEEPAEAPKAVAEEAAAKCKEARYKDEASASDGDWEPEMEHGRKARPSRQQSSSRPRKASEPAACMKEEDADGAAAGPGPGSAAAKLLRAAASRSRKGDPAPAVRKADPTPAEAPPSPPAEKLSLPLGIFLVGIITSSAYTNTQLHIEDLLLMSININIFGAPKIWWWIPKDSVPAFKAFAETLTPGGRADLYTKAVAPFVLDKNLSPAEHRLPLTKLKEFGARRVVQMPGMAILTSPGYAFHFTVSMGLNIAESCNMFLELLGWDVERLWRERPLEQYPDITNSMAQWMYDSGVLSVLGLDPGKLHTSHASRRGSVALPPTTN